MANQTITVDTDIATVIANGLLDGENIVINNGAVLTVDIAPTVMIGLITVNSSGEMLVDGANAVDPIVFVGEGLTAITINGTGKLRTTLGWWEFPTTSNGLANQTFDATTYFSPSIVDEDVISGVWVETGRRINYDTGTGIAPVVGDWVFAVADNDIHGRITEVSGDGTTGFIVVQFLTGALADNDAIELHTIQQNQGPDYQKSWNGLCVGADVLEVGTFQEFGNVYQNQVDFLSQMGSGIGGFGFSNVYGSNTLTFGDGTAGFIPPLNARIRIPMVHFATSTLALIGSGTTEYNPTASSRYEIETAAGGDVELNGVSLGSAQFEDALATNFTAAYIAANNGFGGFQSLNRATYDHCIIVPSHETDVRSTSRSLPAVVDLSNGADVRDCLVVAMNDATETTGIGGQTSSGINIERCIQLGLGNANEAEIVRVNGFTIHDLVVIGTQLVFTTSTDGEVTLLKTQRDFTSALTTGTDQIVVQVSCSRIRIIGWEILQHSHPNDSKITIADSSGIRVYGFHFIDDKYDNDLGGGIEGEEFVNVGGFSSDITIARCWQNNGNPNEFALHINASIKDLTILNCSGEYNGEIEPDGIDTSYRGVQGGSGSLGSSLGFETDIVGTLGANMGDIFASDTAGYIYCNSVPGSTKNPILVNSGNPQFTRDGDVDSVLGDQWEIEMPYFALGHTTFTGVITTTRNALIAADGVDNWTGVDIDFQYDTGTGYNNVWLDLRVPANLTAITGMVDGVRIKVRFTGNVTQTNGQAIKIHTTTTIADQAANFHPLDQVPVVVTVLDSTTGAAIESAAILVRAAVGGSLVVGTQLALGQTDANGVFTFDAQFVTDQPISIRARKASASPFYKPIDTLGIVTLSGLTTTIGMVSDE